MQTHGVLWDMDGVLVDNSRLHFAAWQDVLQAYKVPFSYEIFAETFGQNNRTILHLWFNNSLSEEEMDAIADRKEQAFRRLISPSITPLPGARDWLGRFKLWGVHQAVASSAPQANIDVLVDALRFRQYFDALISGALIPGKPNPDVFLLAARKINIQPQNCLVIEDAPAGIEAAQRAGMRVLALTTTHPAAALAAADLVIPDLTSLSINQARFILK